MNTDSFSEIRQDARIALRVARFLRSLSIDPSSLFVRDGVVEIGVLHADQWEDIQAHMATLEGEIIDAEDYVVHLRHAE